jgi:hypothetical protein
MSNLQKSKPDPETSLIFISPTFRTTMVDHRGRTGDRIFLLSSNSPWIDDGVTCFFPSLDTTREAFYVLVSHCDILHRLTGSARFLSSGSVEDDLLVSRKRGKS